MYFGARSRPEVGFTMTRQRFTFSKPGPPPAILFLYYTIIADIVEMYLWKEV